jgi:hypothetical protein|tara:strand:- start:1337 stop:1741 length:405 start_codon:yes stop_codon:yes gene_type:complete
MTKVNVYYNLKKKCLSVRDARTGLVVKHTHAIRLGMAKDSKYDHVAFIVQEGGRKRVLKEKRKNVHAFVTGRANLKRIPSLEERKTRKPKTLRRVSYNPYKGKNFVDVKTGKPVDYADEVFIDGKNIYIVKEYK